MRAPLKGKFKYLLVIPVGILILSAFYFTYTTERAGDAMLNEKHIDASNHIKMLTMAIEAAGGGRREDVGPNVAACTELINSMDSVYSWAYKRAYGGWELISEWNGPVEFVRFREAIMEKTKGMDSGSFTVSYTTEKGASRELYINFAKMPSNASPEERYLVFSGISRYSLESSVPAWISIGQWACIIVSFGINILLLTWIEKARKAETKA